MGEARTYAPQPVGFMTMRADKKSRRIPGAEMVAPQASLLIHDTAVAMKLKALPTIWPSYPTYTPASRN